MKRLLFALLFAFLAPVTVSAQNPPAVQAQINTNATQINAIQWSCVSGCVTGRTMQTLLLATNTIETAINTLFTTFVPTNSVPLGSAVSASSYATLDLAVATGLPIYLPAGTYTYTGAPFLTIPQDMTFASGAKIVCNAGNIGILGAINAGRSQIFATGCTPSLFNNTKLTTVSPEWWGAVGDSNGTSGNGADNTTPLAAAFASGAQDISFAAGSDYRYVSISSTRANLVLHGESRDVSRLFQDDATGLLDGIGFLSGTGRVTVRDINLSRAQPGIGQVASAEVVSGGTSCPTGTTATIAVGTFAAAAVLTVATDSGGVAQTLSVTTPGSYTSPSLPTATLKSTPAVVPSALSGSCAGLTVKIRWSGPALLHFQDSFFVQIHDNSIGGANAWDAMRFDGSSKVSNQIWIDRNQCFSGEHDCVYMYGASSGTNISDIFIEQRNYIQHWGYAGVEGLGNASADITENILYNQPYGIIEDADGQTGVGNGKIIFNDLDTNSLGEVFNGHNQFQFQNNWIVSGFGLILTNTHGATGGLNKFVNNNGGGTDGTLFVNGGNDASFVGDQYSSIANPVQVGSYGGSSFSGGTFNGQWFFGSGTFLTASGSPSFITACSQMPTGIANLTTGTIHNFSNCGPSTGTNNSSRSDGLMAGQSNNSSSQYGTAVGFANNETGYLNTIFGQYNNTTGTYSVALGISASDDGLFGSACFSSNSPLGTGSSNAGGAQLCLHSFSGRTSSTTPTRLTASGTVADGTNCLNLPAGAHAQFGIQVSAKDRTNAGNWADWTSAGPNVLDRGASTTYSGSWSSATTPGASSGTGSSATVQMAADATHNCLNATVVAPNGDDWDWDITFVRAKVQ